MSTAGRQCDLPTNSGMCSLCASCPSGTDIKYQSPKTCIQSAKRRLVIATKAARSHKVEQNTGINCAPLGGKRMRLNSSSRISWCFSVEARCFWNQCSSRARISSLAGPSAPQERTLVLGVGHEGQPCRDVHGSQS